MCLTVKEYKHFELQRENQLVFLQPKSLPELFQDYIEHPTFILYIIVLAHATNTTHDFISHGLPSTGRMYLLF